MSDAPPSGAEVVVYTRAGCGLCARAERLARRESGRRGSVRLVDVDSDETLARRYGVRVPVVAVGGIEVAELEVAPGTIRRAVRRARRAGRGWAALAATRRRT